MIPRGDLVRRLAVAAIGIPLALVVLFTGGWLLTALVALLAVMATREFDALASARGIRTFSWIGIPGTLALMVLAGLTRSFPVWAPWAVGSLLFLFFLSSASAVKLRTPEERPLLAASLTLVGTLYWGGCFSFAIFLRHLPETTGWPDPALPNQGPALLAFPLAVTWTADTAAYLFGSQFGRRQMIPSVSPGKTVEGGVAGLLSAVLVGAFMGWVFLEIHPDPVVSSLLGGAMGLLMGITIQLGDLIESLYKREAGVKDSGSLLPGHGGILDRFDALIFTLPLTYALVRLVDILL
jgi:phosphatidate cytidylyltransferase